ncbi:MAG TPA: cytochrome c biogenesis protein CcsA [Gemmatimonadales bacterium]|nr:cytochrome c biogenesis protein CcsA [Gemmatimonadales bacterium]
MDVEIFAMGAALGLYVGAGALALAGLLPGAVARERLMLALLAGGVALHAQSLGLRWQRVGTGPFITMHEVISSNVWSLSLVYLLAAWRWRVLRPAAAVVMPVLFVMIAWLLATDPSPGHQPATYRTAWLWVHVGLGKVFLGCVLVAVGLAGVILLRAAGVRSPRLAALPDDARLENLAFRFMVVGFLFESLMLIAGALWAQDAWGRYWAWDPLETWAFLTWLSLAAFLHARVAWPVRPPAAAAMVIAVFVLAFLTFFGVPFVSTAPHKGAV